jgi:hypothetical protein
LALKYFHVPIVYYLDWIEIADVKVFVIRHKLKETASHCLVI